MSRITYSLILNDACWFLNRATATVESRQNKQLTLRYVRATVLFSWVALEQMLDAAVELYAEQGTLVASSVPNRLRDKLEYVLAANGKKLNRSAFKKHRDLRNAVAHDDKAFFLSDVQGAFNFCVETVRSFWPGTVEVTWQDVTRR